jgi:carbon-monoxide dehydrogenase large subunit
MGDVALAVFSAHNLPDGVEPSLDSDATFDPDNFSFPHGTHLCAVEVDTETGRVSIRKYVCVDDVGTPINPLIIEGQVHGGLAQGIAQALFEEAVFDESGNLTTGTFVDYTVPSAAVVHHRPHRDPVDHQPARGQGRRRSRHHRLHPGRRERGRRRAASLRGQ